MAENSLNFKEFSAASYVEWKAAAEKALKGKDFDETLIWQNENGFDLAPYFDKRNPHAEKYDRSHRASGNKWEVRQNFSADNAKSVNEKILEGLSQNLDAVGFQTDAASLDAVLKDVLCDIIAVYISPKSNPVEVLQAWVEKNNSDGKDLKHLRGALEFDPFRGSTLSEILGLAEMASAEFMLFRVFDIEVKSVHNTGGNVAQELGVALAKGHALLYKLIEAGYTVDQLAPMIQFSFATGTSYFEQIAKYRAFRSLWAEVVEAYNPKASCTRETVVLAETSFAEQTVKASANNLLRATTQSMSAILAGVDVFSVLPHNMLTEKDNNFGDRIARNIQHLLRDESYLNLVADPAAGSYYVDELTEKLADVGWAFFQAIEKEGGFEAAEQNGMIKEAIGKAAAHKIESLKSGKKVLVGASKYTSSADETEPVLAVFRDKFRFEKEGEDTI